MSGTLTKAQRAFVPIQQKGNLPAAVRLARSVVSGGLLAAALDDDPCSLAAELAGDLQRSPAGMVSWPAFTAHLYAALAMGIAIGQLVHPDVFKTGGAR